MKQGRPMSRALEKLLEGARNLSPEDRRQLLEALQAPGPKHTAARLETIDRIYGKYSRVRTSSEDFCARKVEEIAVEDRNTRR
ncbi:MAG: hypothetical protein DMG77_16810 [Acidobacteria bacterium]|nr:MAG: hypothetical protein DMG77_16810 [Acidobacteriota bacterium]